MLPDEGRLPSFDRATGWLNSPPLTTDELTGRVVLVDFWTYTCVNWLRTLPYLRSWHEKYARHGLTIVGVHTPEFDFERDRQNITDQLSALGIEYPVAIDTQYGVWEEFANHYWPAVYLADHKGRIRYHHFGEGDYAATEMLIKQLLVDAGATGLDPDLVEVTPQGLEAPAEWQTLRSPETYLGYGQSSGFASEDPRLFDRPHRYDGEGAVSLNSWDLMGDWTVARQACVSNDAPGRIAFRFHARDVNLVMAPATADAAIPFRVYLGGEVVGAAHGSDVDASGHGVLRRPNTYQLVRQSGPVADQLVEIEFLDRGVEAYCVTFG